ncbi:CrcB family protein [Alicyclobacillus sp. SO9]|uniref:fluoride efflux transporter FluC n=1 Tax=Alicyclobacillus sp. SO9 TaxID=2665646 RepID=UPI0018E74DE4|nr:CrcB family protein [Alicyclobacillus sp. SO9]QQE78800.1 CrcB family protein [Alicyclobacillus sp. SO9]
MNIFAIAVFAALGGASRVLLEHLLGPVVGMVPAFQMPFATLVSNLVGSFFIGFFYIAASRRRVREWLQLGVSVGFLGAFTTFSTFTLNILQVATNNPAAALVYTGLSLVGGVFLVLAGESLAESWVRPRISPRISPQITLSSEDVAETPSAHRDLKGMRE